MTNNPPLPPNSPLPPPSTPPPTHPSASSAPISAHHLLLPTQLHGFTFPSPSFSPLPAPHHSSPSAATSASMHLLQPSMPLRTRLILPQQFQKSSPFSKSILPRQRSIHMLYHILHSFHQKIMSITLPSSAISGNTALILIHTLAHTLNSLLLRRILNLSVVGAPIFHETGRFRGLEFPTFGFGCFALCRSEGAL